MGVAGNSVGIGAGIIQYNCNGASNQIWFHSGGTFENKNSHLCLAISSYSVVGAKMIQNNCGNRTSRSVLFFTPGN